MLISHAWHCIRWLEQPTRRKVIMSLVLSGQAINAEKQDLSRDAKSNLTKLAAWINKRNIPFLITSIGMIVMLLWAGSYKMTAPGAEGIVPLVSNSPLIWWHFELFGPISTPISSALPSSLQRYCLSQ